MTENVLGYYVPDEVLHRLHGPLVDFATKLNSENGAEWEEGFKRFLRKETPWSCPHCNPFHDTGEVAIQIPALPRPTLDELRVRHTSIASIERDLSPTDAVILKLSSIFRKEDGDWISDRTYEKRISEKLEVILGYQQAAWLEAHQDELPQFVALSTNIRAIHFSGLLVGDDGRWFPVLHRSDRTQRWRLAFDQLRYDCHGGFSPESRIAYFGK